MIAEIGPSLHIPPGQHYAYDFRLGKPDGSTFPSSVWRKLLIEHFDTVKHAMADYTDPAGHYPLREALCRDLLAGRGIVARPEDVIIVGGTQDGLNLLGRLFQIGGERVAIENPCYEGAAHAFQSLGARLFPIPVDSEGVRSDLLPAKGACLLYVTPSHHFPLGMTMSTERRHALIDWAQRTGSMIVEDDYDSDVQYGRPVPAIKALAPEWTAYVGSFSKSMGPGLRLGYVVLPPRLGRAARAMKATMSNGQPWLEQTILGEFIAQGLFDKHRRKMKARYVARRDALVEAIDRIAPGSHFGGLESGMHLAWFLPPSAPNADRLRRDCAANDVGIYTLAASPCYLMQKFQDHERVVLCGYAGMSPSRIEEAAERVGTAMRSGRS